MNSRLSKYKDFKAVDFFADEDFIQTVVEQKEQQHFFWVELGQQYPYLLAEMELARAWMLLIKRQVPARSSLSIDQRWANIQDQIVVYEKNKRRTLLIRTMLRWTASAAALLLFTLLAYEISQFGPKGVDTAFGEQREIALPDSSIIKLNSNSKLSYQRDWKTDKPREVWIEGEGMFEVKHTAIKNRLRENDFFVVHVGEFSLTVLGTKFNVKDRRGRIEVALFQGSVRVQGPNGVDRLLAPGETFVHDDLTKANQIVKNDAGKVLSWTRDELSIEHSSLANIVAVLEDNYGYKVIVQDSALLNKRFTGVIPAKGIEDILFVIKHTINVNIEVKNKQIVIKPN
ncbi:FecR family protein [Sphingobacterium thalpophilum]|uniref:FecR family protein n=1 Tax=Sphingobacterium thalpophilum TaxID=259 RepID=UPI0037DA0824